MHRVRYFLFEADGTLRRLPMRTVDGLVRDQDRMPQYAGQRPRIAMARFLLDDGAPAQLLKVDGSWWVFDGEGRTIEGHIESMRAAMDAAPDYAAGGTGERDADGSQRRLAQ